MQRADLMCARAMLLLALITAVAHGATPGPLRTRVPARCAPVASAAVSGAWPEWMPPAIESIEEQRARDMARKLRTFDVRLDGAIADGPVRTVYYRTDASARPSDAPPILLLHGFDSSSLEWRRLVPELEALGHDVIAVDILGWGFTSRDRVRDFSSEAKRRHLYEFWRQAVDAPVTLVGTSLGAAFAAGLTLDAPDAVERLALLDPQVLVDGTGAMSSLPRPLASAGVRVLGSRWLRSIANKMSYSDAELFATTDALEVGRLPVELPRWLDGNVEYMLSGGIAISSQLPLLTRAEAADAARRREVLLMWGKDDGIVPPDETAPRVSELLGGARLELLDNCGHVPHLERPDEAARILADFHAGS